MRPCGKHQTREAYTQNDGSSTQSQCVTCRLNLHLLWQRGSLNGEHSTMVCEGRLVRRLQMQHTVPMRIWSAADIRRVRRYSRLAPPGSAGADLQPARL